MSMAEEIVSSGIYGGISLLRHIPFLRYVVEPTSALCCLTVTATKMVARSKLHLCVLEALYIRHLSPDLCAQKNYVLALPLFSPNSAPYSYTWFIVGKVMI